MKDTTPTKAELRQQIVRLHEALGEALHLAALAEHAWEEKDHTMYAQLLKLSDEYVKDTPEGK